MKLIIDIDERAYKGCVKLKNNDDMGVLGFHLINATANGTPLSEELEKIMKELKELAFDFDDLSPDKELVVDLDNIEEVIDKHISELKGEDVPKRKKGTPLEENDSGYNCENWIP